MDNEQYDEMLQDMTLALREIYENATDKALGEHEAASLNDTLDAFFGTKRE